MSITFHNPTHRYCVPEEMKIENFLIYCEDDFIGRICNHFFTIVSVDLVHWSRRNIKGFSNAFESLPSKFCRLHAVADPGGGGPNRPRPPLFSADFCFFWPILADFRARNRGIWITGPPFSQILDPPLTCTLFWQCT